LYAAAKSPQPNIKHLPEAYWPGFGELQGVLLGNNILCKKSLAVIFLLGARRKDGETQEEQLGKNGLEAPPLVLRCLNLSR